METQTSEAQSFKEYKEVVKVLQRYIDSAKSGDSELARSAFYDHAQIVGSMSSEFTHLTTEQFVGAVKTMGASSNVQHQIAWIHISGPAAAASIEFFDWAGFRFTDFLVLFKNDGEWKISGKTFDAHSKN